MSRRAPASALGWKRVIVMQVLVAYGSKRSGTRDMAGWIADELSHQGIAARLCSGSDTIDTTGYDAFIVGGALYTGRWHKNARKFVKRHRTALSSHPVWLFSSGPLDDSAATGDIPATKQVAGIAEQLGARGHHTFGGRLSEEAKGFPASAMAKTMSGDWRDEQSVRAWARGIAAELGA